MARLTPLWCLHRNAQSAASDFSITTSKFYRKVVPVSYQYSTASAVNSTEEDPEWATARPYSEIPGPKPLPIPKFGNVWRMMPFGPYSGLPFSKVVANLTEEHGPVVKLGGLGRPDVIIVTDPSDAEKVFRTEGQWPVRQGLDSLDYYRRVTRYDVFEGNPGIASAQGEEWQKNRTAVNQPMLRPKNIAIFKKPIEVIAQDFIHRIKTIRDENLEMPKNFDNEMSKWALESVFAIGLDARIGCIEGDLKPGSEAQILIDSVDMLFKMLFKLDFQPSLWKYYSTSDWRAFVKAMDNLTDICLRHINRKKEKLALRGPEDTDNPSMLEMLLRTQGGEKTAVTMSIDLLSGGIDTISNSIANVLYFLAKNPEKQEKVFEEVIKLLPNKDDELPNNFDGSLRYLKACIKETQRVASITFGNQRATGKDLVLKGYRIPRGVDILAAHQIMCLQEKNFPQPEQFIPERWLLEKESPLSAKNSHPFLLLPFGFGPRMCIGRRVAELEMWILISKIIRNFKLAYNHGNMEWKVEAITTPCKPLQFRMEDRQK